MFVLVLPKTFAMVKGLHSLTTCSGPFNITRRPGSVANTLLRIRKVPGLDLGPETGYPD
jgi:hypothetical protein